MPNAGIHGMRSMNWNSEDVVSKRSHKATVTANPRIEIASASQRMTPSRRPSLFGISSRSRAPASGRTHESVSMPGLSPQVVAEDQDDPDEERPGIRADRTGLQPTQPGC